MAHSAYWQTIDSTPEEWEARAKAAAARLQGARAVADACALLGVLGYLSDPGAVLRKVHAAFERVVLSYAAVPLTPEKLAKGRCNSLGPDELRRLIGEAGFTVVLETRLPTSELLFELRSTNA